MVNMIINDKHTTINFEGYIYSETSLANIFLINQNLG